MMLASRLSSARAAHRVALTGVAAAGIGTIAYCSQSLLSTNASSTTRSEGMLLAASKSQGRESIGSVAVPTLEATGRVLRLARTAALMALDYKLANSAAWKSLSTPRLDESPSKPAEDNGEALDSNQDQDNQREYWEAETERRRAELERAQEVYSTESHPDLHVHERLEVKRHEKAAMKRAALALAEAEEELARRGSAKSRVHRRAAQRLLELCQTNKGVYIKVGQHLASLDYLIPLEYIETLSALFDNNPRTPIEDVRHVVLEDLGQPIETLFESFDPVPIASASLAQVHVAREVGTGRELAVKVQHRGLRETSAGDLFALVLVVRAAERLFEDFKWGWLADEIAPQLPKELDFVNEGRNAERAARHLAETGLDCVVPRIVWSQSSPRVLTMEFEEGFKATDVAAIERHRFRKKDVARLISSVFSSQVFASGFVHCDPHPANVLLRPNRRDGQPQLVLVDHGLYRELDADFRLRYAKLWRSLMLADLDGIRNACKELGVERTYALFAAVLTARPFDEMIERSKQRTLRTQARSSSGARADQAVIRGYAHRFLHDIFDLLGSVPRQMLLLLKMNDCLRHIDMSLGSPTNTMVICGKYAAMSVYKDAVQNCHSVWGRLSAWWDFARVMLRIRAHDATVWWLENGSFVMMQRLVDGLVPVASVPGLLRQFIGSDASALLVGRVRATL